MSVCTTPLNKKSGKAHLEKYIKLNTKNYNKYALSRLSTKS